MQADKYRFDAKDIGIVVVTYDSEADQQKFATKYGVNYALVSDRESTTVRALGIFNDQNEEGDMAYGVPHPGFFVLDNVGTIRHRSFLEGYQKRLNAATVLSMADQALTE